MKVSIWYIETCPLFGGYFLFSIVSLILSVLYWKFHCSFLNYHRENESASRVGCKHNFFTLVATPVIILNFSKGGPNLKCWSKLIEVCRLTYGKSTIADY